MATSLARARAAPACATRHRIACPSVRPARRSLVVRASTNEAQQRTATSGTAPPTAGAASPEPTLPAAFDTDYFHYSRSFHWWQKRAVVLGGGIAFIVAAEVLEGPSIKTSLLAAVPVLLIWYLLLKVLPQNFKSYATSYIASHPEVKPDNSSN